MLIVNKTLPLVQHLMLSDTWYMLLLDSIVLNKLLRDKNNNNKYLYWLQLNGDHIKVVRSDKPYPYNNNDEFSGKRQYYKQPVTIILPYGSKIIKHIMVEHLRYKQVYTTLRNVAR